MITRFIRKKNAEKLFTAHNQKVDHRTHGISRLYYPESLQNIGFATTGVKTSTRSQQLFVRLGVNTKSNETHDDMYEEIPERSPAAKAVEISILLLIDAAALFGNLLVCIASYKNKSLRTSTNVYIIALAIMDILTACVTAPLSLGAIMKGRWIFGDTGCRVQGFFTHFLIYSSMHILALTAVNRYFRIVNTRYYKRVFGGCRPVLYLLGVWTSVALIVSLPPSLGFADFAFEPGVSLYLCILDFNTSTGEHAFLFIVLFLYVVLSMAIIIASYISVSKTIRHHNLHLQTTIVLNHRLGHLSVEEIKITRTLFILVMAFAVLWIPVYSVVSIIRTGLGGEMTDAGSIIATYLIFLSSAINPYIYAFNHRSYRNEFKKILSWKSNEVVGPAHVAGGHPVVIYCPSNCDQIQRASQ